MTFMPDFPRQYRTKRISALAARALLCIAWLLSAALFDGSLAQTLVKGTAITIDDADNLLRARMPGTTVIPPAAVAVQGSTSTGCAGGSTQPVEITTLAVSLKCDLDLIYEYVYNNIEYEPLFGSNKGALGTLLDQRGSDIDQAQLFVALLNAAGITQTNYIYGSITVTGAKAPSPGLGCPTTATSAPGWLGVKDDGHAILNIVMNGGIPFQSVTTSGSDGTLTCMSLAHVWVQVTISGTNYVFDPSFKQHIVSTGLPNLGSILGYDQSQFLADAGGTIDSVSISGINRTKMRSNLVSYANNLVTYIKANNPTFTTSDVIGGKKIVPLAGSPIRQTSLPYLSTSQPAGFPQIWGSSVPNAYRTCFTISMPGVAPTQCGSVSSQTIQFFSDQVYGQRITIFSVPVPGSSNLVPTLLINGVVPSNGVNTGTRGAPGTTWNVSVCVKHPYANLDADVCHTNPVTDAMVVKLSAGGSYLVSNGWGQVSRGMIEKHRQLLSQALSVSGVDPSSEPVLGESLAVIGYNWLAEVALQQQTLDAIGQTVIQYHHGVGIIAQSAIQQTGHQGPYVDLPSNILNVDPQTCFPNICISVPITGPFFPVVE
jgi:hypothetical protein